MADLLDYKCPNCGGAVAFDSTSQQMKCPYCEASFDVKVFNQNDPKPGEANVSTGKFDIRPGEAWRAGEQDGVFIYSCRSCGGDVLGDANMAATSCPYCSNNVVVQGQFSGDLRPDYVIPFMLNKQGAKNALIKHISSKKFVPKIFKDRNHIDEIKGIYVPFWLFDADTQASIHYRAKTISHSSDSNYNYTTTRHYDVVREGTIKFAGIPVDGSSKIPDDLMESIEPYAYDKIVDFQTAYLAGYLADRYDIGAEQSVGRANERMAKSTGSLFAGTASGYSNLAVTSSNIQLLNGKVKYALLPVWFLKTKWKNETYTFAMNGQTGKLSGNLPIDKGALWRHFALWALLGTAGVFALQWIFMWIAR